MDIINKYGGLIMLYLIFQVGIGTYARLLGKDIPKYHDSHIGLKTYIILLIPVIGVFFAVFCVFRLAFKK